MSAGVRRRRLLIVVLLLVTVFALDNMIGRWSPAQTRPVVALVGDVEATDVAVVCPGYAMPADVLARSLATRVPSGRALLVVTYGERAIDIADIYEALQNQLDRLRPTRLRFYGASMGGLVAADLADGYAAEGSPYGIATLVLDSAPASRDDAKVTAAAFWVAGWYSGGPISGVLFGLGASLAKQRPPVEDPLDPALVALADEGIRASSWMPLPVRMAHADYIGHEVGGPWPRGHMGPVRYVHGSDPATDPAVDVLSALPRWRTRYPNLQERLIDGRQGAWHIPLIERPRETVSAIWTS